MDVYPEGSLDHNVPLLVVSGLNGSAPEPPLGGELKDQGILVRSSLPPLETREAAFVEQHLQQVDEKGRSWVAVRTDEPYRFRIKSVGRVCDGHSLCSPCVFADNVSADLFRTTSPSSSPRDWRRSPSRPRPWPRLRCCTRPSRR